MNFAIYVHAFLPPSLVAFGPANPFPPKLRGEFILLHPFIAHSSCGFNAVLQKGIECFTLVVWVLVMNGDLMISFSLESAPAQRPEPCALPRCDTEQCFLHRSPCSPTDAEAVFC